MLEELGLPYDLVRIDLSKGEQRLPDYLKIHPHGAVPALQDGSITMFESGAICAYLAERYPDKRLAPAPGTPSRAAYEQWMYYSLGTFEPPVVQVFMNTVRLPEGERSAAAAEEGKKKFADVGRVLEAAVAGKRYLIDDRFSAANVMIGSSLQFVQPLGLLAGFPRLEDYLGALTDRPAFKRAAAD
jgi:glutathione S-transferase